MFHFGHGLSYTDFKYSNLHISKSSENNFTISIDITNTGNHSGYEISQCYISFADRGNEEPIKKLQGFDKTFINSGETKKIEICLDSRNFSTWDIETYVSVPLFLLHLRKIILFHHLDSCHMIF